MDTETQEESEEAEPAAEEKSEALEEKTPVSSSKNEVSRAQDKGISPPLKLKIKFGKDKTGAITHGKIKSKHSPSSGEEKEETTKTSSKRSSGFKAPHAADDIPLPEDPDAPIHGFPVSMMDQEHEPRDFKGWDLTTPFRICPTVFVSISSKKTAKGGNLSTPSSSTPKQSVAVEESGGKSRLEQQQVRDSPEQSKLAAALRGEITRTGTPKSAISTPVLPKANYKQINFTRPLYEGWVRELVWRNEESKEGDVFYYPPQAGIEPRKKIRKEGELEAYLITSGSQFPLTFFTFKKEAVGGPEGGEIIRDAEDSAKALESKAQESNQGGTASLVLGKRVSKPPEKLVAEQPAESSTLTPSRTSKRVIRPPGKYSDEEPPSKVARVETGERRPSAGIKELGGTPTNAKEPARDWTQAVKEETMLKQAKASSPTVKQVPGLPGLKLKTFSKMNADSRNQVQEKVGAATAGESDVIMVEGEPETAPAPPMPPLAMSVSKVKKPQMPNLPRGTLITLPGAPTTGPPPAARSYPTSAPPARQPAGTQSSALTPGGVSITSLGTAPMGGPRSGSQSIPNLNRSPLSAMPQHRNLKSVGKYLRPSKPTQLPCSIHCLGVTAIPSLSCTACHCLYHPKCVGLPHAVATSQHQHQFYCNDCIPPPDRTGPVSAPTSGPGMPAQAASKESAATPD